MPGKRDRALLLVGFAGALRRSELVGLMAAPDSAGGSWIEQNSDGFVIHLGKTKTDQEGAGAESAKAAARRAGIPCARGGT